MTNHALEKLPNISFKSFNVVRLFQYIVMNNLALQSVEQNISF